MSRKEKEVMHIHFVLKREKKEDRPYIEHIEKRYGHISLKSLFMELLKRDMEERKR